MENGDIRSVTKTVRCDFSVSSVNTKGRSSVRTRALTEHVRTHLAHHISNLPAGDTGYVPLITLSPE